MVVGDDINHAEEEGEENEEEERPQSAPSILQRTHGWDDEDEYLICVLVLGSLTRCDDGRDQQPHQPIREFHLWIPCFSHSKNPK